MHYKCYLLITTYNKLFVIIVDVRLSNSTVIGKCVSFCIIVNDNYLGDCCDCDDDVCVIVFVMVGFIFC